MADVLNSKKVESESKDAAQDATESAARGAQAGIDAGLEDFGKFLAKRAQRAMKKGSLGQLARSITEELTATGQKLNKPYEDVIKKQMLLAGYTEDHFKFIMSALKTQKEYIAGNLKDVTGIVEALTEPIDALMQKISKSKIGDFMLKSMGIDEISRQMKDKMGKALLNVGEDGKIGFKQVYAASKEMFKGIGEMAKAFFANPFILAMTAILALIVMAWKRFQDVQKTLSAIRTEAGILGEESDRIVDIAQKANIELAQFGVTMEIAGKSAIALANEFQNSSRVTKDLIKATSLMQSNLGMAADEAAQYMSVMQSAANLTDAQAANTAGLVANLAKAGGVAPRKVLADMAKSGEVLNKWLRGSTTEFMKQAVALARMGSSLEKAGSQAEKLLDWDTSITNEMNASVMMGKHLDLSMARYYAFAGKLDEMTGEISKQVGDLDNFDKQNVLTKQAIADAVGLTIGELTKQLKQQQELSKMTDAQRRDYAAAQVQLKDLSKGLTLLQETQKQIAQEKLSQAFEKLSVVLSTILLPLMNLLLPLMEGLASIVNVITGNFEGFAKAFSETSSFGERLAKVIGALIGIGLIAFGAFKLGSFIMRKFGKDAQKTGGDVGEGLAKAGEGAGKGAANLSRGLAASAPGIATFGAAAVFLVPIILALSVALAAVALAIFALAQLVKALAPIIVSLISGIVEIVKAVIKGVVDSIYAITYSIKELVGLTPQMFIAANGIVAMAGALLLFGAAAAGGGIMAGIGGLLGGSVVGQLVKLAMLAEPLKTVASSIVQLAAALGTFSNLNIANLERAVSAMSSLIPLSPLIVATAIPLVAAGAAITATAGGAAPAADTRNGNAEVVSRLDELIGLIKAGSDVNMDGSKVGRVLARQIAHPVVTTTG